MFIYASLAARTRPELLLLLMSRPPRLTWEKNRFDRRPRLLLLLYICLVSLSLEKCFIIITFSNYYTSILSTFWLLVRERLVILLSSLRLTSLSFFPCCPCCCWTNWTRWYILMWWKRKEEGKKDMNKERKEKRGKREKEGEEDLTGNCQIFVGEKGENKKC